MREVARDYDESVAFAARITASVDRGPITKALEIGFTSRLKREASTQLDWYVCSVETWACERPISFMNEQASVCAVERSSGISARVD